MAHPGHECVFLSFDYVGVIGEFKLREGGSSKGSKKPEIHIK